MGLEFELKFDAKLSSQVALIRAFPTWDSTQMHTAYYDTPSYALAKRKITLRCRWEDDVPVCTVKTPAGELARGEWEVAGQEDIAKAIPALCELGAPRELLEWTREGLTCIGGAVFTRRSNSVTEGDTVMEVSLDIGYLYSGEEKQPLQEMEVELKSGSREVTVAWANRMAASCDMQPEPRSKFSRVMELRKRYF